MTPDPGPARYALPETTGFVALPYYRSLTRPAEALRGMARSLATFWRVLGEVDGVWLMGPHPLGVAFALLAFARGRSVALGVRQDFPRYVRARNPDRRWTHGIADLLEGAWRLMGRFVPVVVVGPALAEGYRPARTLVLSVSLVREQDIAPRIARRAPAPMTPVSCACSASAGWRRRRTRCCWPTSWPHCVAAATNGACSSAARARSRRRFAERLAELGVEAHAELLGYVPHDQGLQDIYRSSHALLHVSWTEGLPQVLFEAFAARLPIVATDVGGVRAAAGDCALMIQAGHAEAAVDALERIRLEPELRARLTEAGAQNVAERTLEAEARRVARFLARRSL